MQLTHCSSDHNTSRDLEFDKNFTKIGNHGCYNFKEKAIWGENTIVLWIPLLDKYPNPDAKILPIEKFPVSAQVTQEHRPRIFFPAHCTVYVREFYYFFCDDRLVQEFFTYAYSLAGYLFF